MAAVTRSYTSGWMAAVLAALAVLAVLMAMSFHLGSRSSRSRAWDARHGAAGAALQGRRKGCPPRSAPPGRSRWGATRRCPTRRRAPGRDRRPQPGAQRGTGRGSRRSAPLRAKGGAQGRVADSPPARAGAEASESERDRQGRQAGTREGWGHGGGDRPRGFQRLACAPGARRPAGRQRAVRAVSRGRRRDRTATCRRTLVSPAGGGRSATRLTRSPSRWAGPSRCRWRPPPTGP